MRLLRSWHRDEYARRGSGTRRAHRAAAADNGSDRVSPRRGARDARIHLGGVLQTRERCLDAMTFRWITLQFRR